MKEQANINYILELAAGSKEFEQKLIQIIKNEFPEEKSIFLDNYQNQRYIQTAENVHKLKNKIGMMGLENGYQVAIDFEKELRKNKSSLFPKFMLTLDTIEAFLETL